MKVNHGRDVVRQAGENDLKKAEKVDTAARLKERH